jgi:hypothetical protein
MFILVSNGAALNQQQDFQPVFRREENEPSQGMGYKKFNHGNVL